MADPQIAPPGRLTARELTALIRTLVGAAVVLAALTIDIRLAWVNTVSDPLLTFPAQRTLMAHNLLAAAVTAINVMAALVTGSYFQMGGRHE